jgi:hypothetical protein
MADHIHLVKLCVGTDSVEELIGWQAGAGTRTADGLPVHVTRMWPRRAAELLAGGSLYWVIRGVILARQRLLRLDERRGPDGILRCALVLDPDLVRTEAAPRRAFQGWRYLDPADTPRDLSAPRERETALPPELAAALADIGVR